jgi:solute carrier family 25 (mitochondrial citrate transporter), member 1
VRHNPAIFTLASLFFARSHDARYSRKWRLIICQTANFTAYSYLRTRLQGYQGTADLPAWQTSIIGLISGAMGPFSNAPIDTIKTRLQKTPAKPGETAVSRIVKIAADMWKQEGARSFYKGITPRVMRVAPGQAVTFTVYEYLREILERGRDMLPGGVYEE